MSVSKEMCVISPCLTTHVVSASEIIDNSEETNGITKCFDLYTKGRKYSGVELKQAWADADADDGIVSHLTKEFTLLQAFSEF